MSELIADISISLDGYVAGPDPSAEDPLGRGGEHLHEWLLAAAAWHDQHGSEGGEDSVDSELLGHLRERVGATIMGRRMYSGGSGPWRDDPRPDGWWGENPPFHQPVFVLSSHPRDPRPMQGGTTYTFVADGIEAALARARAAADGKDVLVAGGGHAIAQYMAAGLLDELSLHVAPVLLGGGRRLFDGVGPGRMERTRVIESPSGVTHLMFRAPRR